MRLETELDQWRSGDGVVYMLTGTKHAPMLAVSLLSLRTHYVGPVAIIAGDPSAEPIVRQIASDRRLGDIEVIVWDAPVGGGKGLQHANKVNLIDLSPFDRTVFLDADTMVTGSIVKMLPRAGTEEVRLTQMADWVTTGTIISKRINAWRDVLRSKVSLMSGIAYPAINTGVFGFTKLSTRYFDALKKYVAMQPTFMCDEIVAQLIFVDFPHVIMPHIYNYSCRFSPEVTPVEDARVIHFHGMKHVKTTIGLTQWVPLYDEACESNIGCIRDWTPAKDKRLAAFLKERTKASCSPPQSTP